ncbi:MAG: hypothetical protein ACOC4G_07165 [Bacillota bacterium]
MNKNNGKFKPLFRYLVFLLILFTFFLTATFSLTANDDIYPSKVMLTIRSGDKIVEEDDFFDIIDQGDYILIPLSALSNYLEIELDYERDDEQLFVSYPETDKTIEIDFRDNTYPDFPDLNNEPPVIFEGDFFVAQTLIEELTGTQLEWSFRKQELDLSLDDFDVEDENSEEEEEIKERPDDEQTLEPDVKGANFSLGSFQYNTGLDYNVPEREGFSEGSWRSKNNLYLHGRIGNWALSLGQNINYNFQKETYSFNNPLIRARNRENNRLIVLGDGSIDLADTAGKQNIRGIYFQYPHRQVRGENSYTSINGQAEEGSTVKLYVNEVFVDEKYVYKGEDTYHFSRVQLRNYRTNEIKIVIENVEGEKEEIVEEIAGSNYLFEANTNQGQFALGKTRESGDESWKNDLAGFQMKYAPSRSNSLSWELAAQREQLEDEGESINLGSLFRFAHRTQIVPAVLNIDWLAGGEMNSFEHGLRSRLMYTLDRGYLSTTLGYVPPEIKDYVDSEVGGRAAFNFQHQLGNFWMADLSANTVRSIKDMTALELYLGNFSLRYRDNLRNSFSLAGEYATREHKVYWDQLNVLENNRDWASIALTGKTDIYNMDLSGELDYKTDWINFTEEPDTGKLENAEIELESKSRLTENIVTEGNIETNAEWFDNELQEQDLYFGGSLKSSYGNNTLTLEGFSERMKNGSGIDDEDQFTENRREVSLRWRYFNRPHLNLTGELKNTYLYLLNDNYYSVSSGVNYNSEEQDWEIDLDLGYNFPIGMRETSQEEMNLKLTKGFASGHEAFISAGREYRSLYQEEPSYAISLGISQSLNFVKDKILGREYSGGTHRSDISGVVYLDQDGTGVRNENDPLISDISMYKDGTRTETDENGEFKFENVRSDLHEVGIDLDNLDAKYNVVTEEKLVRVRENENMFLEFGVTMSGDVSGRVYLDRKVTGTYDEEDKNISMVGIEIEELDESVYSDGDGKYHFDNVPLGQYTVRVLPDTIPGGMKVAGDKSFEVNIEEDSLTARDLNISLIHKTD